MRTTHNIVTRFHVDCQTHDLFPHTYTLAYLRSGPPLSCNFSGPSHEGVTLLRVVEILHMDNLKFPVFFDKGYDDESIVGEHGPGSGMDRC